MKDNHFFAKVNICLICVGLILSSCKKDPEMGISLNEIIIEPIQIETETFKISSNVEWTLEILQSEDKWLTASPLYGRGNATITLEASENGEFAERIAFIAVLGEGLADTLKVLQLPSLDVAEKFKDEIFRQYCLHEFDTSPRDGKISLKEASDVFVINVKGKNYEDEEEEEMNKITSLAGIEYFSNLKELYCSNNRIEEIDVSNNKDLRKLDCSFNPIGKIDVSELYKLTDLYLHTTNIKSLDVSNNALLYLLTTSTSPITSLDVTENKELAMLLCNGNQLTNLDVTKNTKLVMLYCGSNRLSTLDISMNTHLVNLWCNNQVDNNNRKLLTNLDISQNISLQTLSCGQNGITSLHLNNNAALRELRCDDNLLIGLDVSQNTKLEDLKCNNNQLKGSIDISNNKLLKYIDLTDNQSLDIIYVWQGFDATNSYYEKDKTADYKVK